VAALAAGDPVPALPRERLERAIAALERDGLEVRDAAGTLALPS
jgi:hypothetical protein